MKNFTDLSLSTYITCFVYLYFHLYKLFFVLFICLIILIRFMKTIELAQVKESLAIVKNFMESSHLQFLCYKIQWSIESSFPVHVLSILSFKNNMYGSYIIPFNFFAFSSVKTTKAHYSHHFLFLWCFSLKIGLCNIFI